MVLIRWRVLGETVLLCCSDEGWGMQAGWWEGWREVCSSGYLLQWDIEAGVGQHWCPPGGPEGSSRQTTSPSDKPFIRNQQRENMCFIVTTLSGGLFQTNYPMTVGAATHSVSWRAAGEVVFLPTCYRSFNTNLSQPNEEGSWIGPSPLFSPSSYHPSSRRLLISMANLLQPPATIDLLAKRVQRSRRSLTLQIPNHQRWFWSGFLVFYWLILPHASNASSLETSQRVTWMGEWKGWLGWSMYGRRQQWGWPGREGWWQG